MWGSVSPVVASRVAGITGVVGLTRRDRASIVVVVVAGAVYLLGAAVVVVAGGTVVVVVTASAVAVGSAPHPGV